MDDERAYGGLHLFALSGLAVAQPLYDLIGRHATFLVAHGAGAGTVLALVIVLSFGISLTLAASVSLARLISRRAAVVLQTVFVALLGGLLAAVALRTQEPRLAMAGAGLAALAAGAAYQAPVVRLFLTVLSPAALLFPILFLTTSGAARLLWPAAHAPASDGPRERPPIVMVVFDEMSSFDIIGADGRLDAARFPNIAALAATSTWFPNATAADAFTARALPAMVTGVTPTERKDLLPFATDHPQNLLTWLGQSYEMVVEEPMTQLCPRDICADARALDPRAFARDLAVLYLHLTLPADAARRRLPPVHLGWTGFDGRPAPLETSGDWTVEQAFADALDRGRASRFRAFIASVRGPSRPVFYFAHALLPHDPYRYRASGRIYAERSLTDGLPLEGYWPDDAWVVDAARERHIEQARFTDALLGELIARLEREGLFDEALIVVTADHGGSFIPGHMHRWPTQANYLEVAAVPLLVKRPRQAAGAINTSPVSGVDIAPTIASALGVTLPWPHDGAAAFAEPFPERADVRFDGYDLPPQPRVEVPAEAARLAARPPANAPYRTLVGQRVSESARDGAPMSLRVISTAFDDLRDVRPESGFVPSLARGHVEGTGGEPLVIAIAVDGTIGAVTRTFAWQGASHHFAVLLPETAIVPGGHQIEFFAVHGAAGAWRLAPISSELTAGLRLESGPKGQVVVTASDVRLPIDNEPAGQVDRIEISDAVIILHGWAIGPDRRSPARSIVVFAGSESVATTTPAHPRPDVSTALGFAPDVPTSFGIMLPRGRVAAAPVRLFAFGDGAAGEITLPSHVAAELARLK